MNDWKYKWDEVQILGTKVLNKLDNFNNLNEQSKEISVNMNFKDFCGQSFHLVNDWLNENNCLSRGSRSICVIRGKVSVN